jgi:quinol---cytochrome-c reductase cytochrome c subunit
VRILNRSAGLLSRRRRSKLAGLVVVVAALLVTGGAYSALAPASAEQTVAADDQVAQGRQLFLVGCSFCHGQNGEGVLLQDGSQLGPSLVGVGAAAVDFQVGTGRMPMAEPGAQAARKPPVYTEDEIAALAAYVASIGPGPAIPSENDYSLEGLSSAEREAAVVRGGQIFLTNCTACHNFNGSGGAMPRGGYAPSLHGVEAKYIYEAMLTGPQAMDVFSNGNLAPDEKRDVIAYILSIQENPEYGGFGLGGFGPVAEGLVAWIVGIGALVAFAIWIAAHTARTSRRKGDA